MKGSLLITICFCIAILSGCSDRVEMNELAIITAAAIDRLEDGKTRVSVQLFIPRAITSGETGEDPSSGSTFVREGVGDNLANAISLLQINVPRRLFWGQCKIFIFGKGLAQKGIRKDIDYLARHPSPRGNSLLFVSEAEAKEMLTLIPPLERYSGDALKKLSQDEDGTQTTLRDVDIGLMDESESVSMPYIKKLEQTESARKPNETIPVITGAAIFKNDKMAGTLDLKESRGLLWLKDEIKRSSISVKPEGANGKLTMTPTLGSTKFSPEIKDGRWIMNLNIRLEGDIVQNETHFNLMNEAVIKKIRKDFEAALKERVAQTIEKLQQEYRADVIGFGRRFHQKYPKEWKKVKENWDEKFPEVEVKIKVKAKVRRPGYIGPPAALPRDEVKE
ncbi:MULTISPECIES: Ger(x)C family spore germination protein [unclassified Cytobacillus]|uniref:Ger(x)C family spore germination protein n=1 Tax=unclassified Cytobacillus TaxID=2675268 RepID=UPI0020424D54|nr:Ger(x)C family spore germination protein [Cytobacillus sp. AMY 15.2]MCM3089750.1 Ger(x)C family spore germination protein [Cytobacillus sp. AMY 15.2]